MLRLALADDSTWRRLQGVHEGLVMCQVFVETMAAEMTDEQILRDPKLKLLELYDDSQPETTYD